MKHVYANLLGTWVNLNEDENCVMDTGRSRPSVWVDEQLGELFDYDYINIYYKGDEYRIHPTCIQIVTRSCDN